MANGFPVDCKRVRPFCSYTEGKPSFAPTKTFSVSSICDRSKNMPNHFLKSHTWDSRVKVDNGNLTKIEEINTFKKCPVEYLSLSTSLEKEVPKDIFQCPSYQAKCDSAQYTLLMDNISEIENILVDSQLEKLENDILVQIKRLGALQLFRSCLSRTFKAEDALNKRFLFIENEDSKKNSIGIRSVKRKTKKLRRKQALKKLSMLSNPSYLYSKYTSMPTCSPSSSKRYQIARNESEMATRVKEVYYLERIRLELEEKIGRQATFAKWAEAAAIDQETLKHRLLFGWHCRDKLLKSARSLVLFLAKSYTGMGLGSEELIQAGNVGVLLGAERFDSTKGYQFSTYVQHWIRKSMSELVARHSRRIHLPATLDKIIKQIKKARRTLTSHTGIHPRENEIAEFTGIPLAKVRLADRCSRPVGSFEQTLRSSWNIKFSDIIPDTSIEAPETTVMKLHMRKDIHMLLEGLNPRERQVLILRYGLGDGRCKSLSEISQFFGVSKERIRKIEKASLSKLRMKSIQAEMKHYIGI